MFLSYKGTAGGLDSEYLYCPDLVAAPTRRLIRQGRCRLSCFPDTSMFTFDPGLSKRHRCGFHEKKTNCVIVWLSHALLRLGTFGPS